MSDILFTINGVLPVFFVIGLGYAFTKFGLLTTGFVEHVSKPVYAIFLPALIFLQIVNMDVSAIPDVIRTSLIGVAAIIIHFIILWFLVPLFIKDNATAGAYIQGVFRSNYILIGIPLAINLFGPEGAALCAVMLAFIMPFYVVFSVIALSKHVLNTTRTGILSFVVKTIKNPYIIAVFSGLIFLWASIPIPSFVDTTLSYFASVATPLALLIIGAFLNVQSIKEYFLPAFSAALLKTIVLPIFSLPIVYLIGLRSIDFGVLFILFASPSAVSSFIMAKGMHSNATLSANIIILSTAMSAFTIFFGVWFGKAVGIF